MLPLREFLFYVSSIFLKIELKSAMQPRLREVASYAAIGLCINSAAIGVYLLLVAIGFIPELASFLLYISGASLSYLGNRNLTFDSTVAHATAVPRFILAHSFGLALQLALLAFLRRPVGLSHQLSQIIAVCLVAVYLYTTFKYYVYPQRNDRSSRGSP